MARGAQALRCARVSPQLREETDAQGLLALLEEPDSLVTNVQFAGLELEDAVASGTAFNNVVFKGCSFDCVCLANCTLHDVAFVGCRFVRADFARSWLDHVDFRSCSLPGASFLKGRLTSVLFDDCQMPYADWSEVLADRLTAHATNLSELVANGVRALRRVQLSACSLERATFFKTSLAGIDLSDCELAGIRVSSDLHELRGATIASEQAVQLVGFLGVNIKEETW